MQMTIRLKLDERHDITPKRISELAVSMGSEPAIKNLRLSSLICTRLKLRQNLGSQ